MKQLIFIISLFFTLNSFSQKNSKDVVGFYISNDETSIFKFYKSGDKYVGKLVWMKHPERKDTMNPDVSKRNKKLLGSLVVYGMKYDGKHTWTDGFVYDATKGKTFQCHICRDAQNNLSMRGYLGVPVLGKTEYFVKVDFKEI